MPTRPSLNARGRTKIPAFIGIPRALSRDDMSTLLKPIFGGDLNPNKIRDSHHRIARLAAAGLRPFEIAERVGYSYDRIKRLIPAPAMQELIAKYRARVDAKYETELDEYYSLKSSNMMKAERQIADRLDDEAVTIPTRELIAISADGADRVGYAKRSLVANIHGDFAAELEKAIARSGKIIEVEPTPQGLRRRL